MVAKKGPMALCSLMQVILLTGPSAASFALPLTRPNLHKSPVNRDRSTMTTVLSATSGKDESSSVSRRNLLLSLPFVSVFGSSLPSSAELVQFPCKTLQNTYHFMRAGQSLLEEQDIWSTNPLYLTNREAALSDFGMEQVHEACQYMEAHDINPSVVKFSLAANAMDTADIVSMDLLVGRNRLVPEYTYMDQRGIGKWDMLPLHSTQDAVWAMDAKEAGKEGLGGRPPPHDDGTPNETLSNQVTRLRQLMSLLESSLSGDSILLIFPDGTGPAVLSCLIAGIPLDRAHELNYGNGEVRLDVNYNNVRAMLPLTPTAEYGEAIARGSNELKALRAMEPNDIKSVIEQVQEAEEAAAQEKEAALAKAKAEAQQEKERALRARKEELEASRRKQVQQQEEERQQKRELSGARKRDLGVTDFVVLGALGLGASIASFGKHDSLDDDYASQTVNTNQTNMQGANVTALPDDLGSSQLETLKETRDLVERDLAITNASEAIVPEDDLAATSPELQSMEALIQEAPIDIPEFASLEEERMEIAEHAMEEYMNQDDGGDAWLAMMSEVMAEED